MQLIQLLYAYQRLGLVEIGCYENFRNQNRKYNIFMLWKTRSQLRYYMLKPFILLLAKFRDFCLLTKCSLQFPNLKEEKQRQFKKIININYMWQIN